MSPLPNLIGERRTTPSAETLPVYDPATAQVIEQVPLSGPNDVDAAVQADEARHRR
jgi:malonate-semialdehyde dehydrogenase (acetylating)/methylmalonate-semialdehyde dehydrogenase